MELKSQGTEGTKVVGKIGEKVGWVDVQVWDQDRCGSRRSRG